MDLINKGLSSFLLVALVFLAVAFLINILPVILVIGAGVFAISYAVKKFKLYFRNKISVFNNKYEDVEIVKNMNFSESNVIDVDYTEVK